MALKWPDRTLETCVTTGTGPLALTGAVTGFQGFSEELTVADTIYGVRFAIDVHSLPTGLWETAHYTYSAANQLTTTTFVASSTGFQIDWPVGAQWVMACPVSVNYSDWLESMAGALQAGNNLSDVADAAAALANLGGVDAAYVDAGDTSTLTDAETYTDAAIAAIAGNGTGTPPNGVVSGLGLVYTGSGLVWSMSAGSANINGELVTASAQTVTLATADATNPRLDTFYLDDTGTFGKITGTAATNPSLPTVDPTSQLYLGFALVPATATDLTSTITTEAIYTEGVEWTGTASGSGVTIGSTTNPKTGTKCIAFTAVAANAFAKFVDGSPSTFDGTSSTLFSIRSQGAWNSKRSVSIQYFNASGVAQGTPVVFKEGSFGFVSSNSSSYQDVVIPETLFAVPAGTVRGELRFTVKGTGGTMGFYLDDIKVQTIAAGSGGTGGGGVSNGITQDQADARYLKLTGGTITGSVLLPASAYGAGWNGSLKPATEDAVYDKIETVIAGGSSGTVTSVAGTGTVNGLTLTGTVTTSGNLTLGGTLAVGTSAITNSAVTLAKIANAAANSKLLGSGASGSGAAYAELTLGTNLSMTGTTLNAAGGALSDADYGDIVVSSSGTVMTIDSGVVSLAKMANMATASLIYRKTAGSGAPEVNTLATLKTDLGLTGTNSGDQTITLTGNVTGSGTGSFAATIANSAVTLAKIANAAASSKLLGSGASGSGAAYVELTLGTGLSMSGTTLNASPSSGAVQTLTDAATVTIDASTGNNFRWTIGGNRTFANPTNPTDGQQINVRIIQDATGGRLWTLGSKFKFSGTPPLLSTAANAKDFLSCQYDATDDTWFCAIAKAMQ